MTDRNEPDSARAPTAKLNRDEILGIRALSPLAPPEVVPVPRPTAGEYSVLQKKPRAATEPGRASSPSLSAMSAHTTPDGHVQLSVNGQTLVLTAADARSLATLIVNLTR